MPFSPHSAPEEVQRSIRKVVNRLADADLRSSPGDRLAELESGFSDGIALVRKIRQDPVRYQAMDTLRSAVARNDVGLALEYLQRGLQPDPLSRTHVESFASAATHKDTRMLLALQAHGWGIPQEPEPARQFLDRILGPKADPLPWCSDAVKEFSQPAHEAVAQALRQHCQPGDLLVTAYANRMLGEGRRDVLALLGDHAPLESLAFCNAKTPVELDLLHFLAEKGVRLYSPQPVGAVVEDAFFRLGSEHGLAPQDVVDRIELVAGLKCPGVDAGKPVMPEALASLRWASHLSGLDAFDDGQLQRLARLGVLNVPDSHQVSALRECTVQKNAALLERLLACGADAHERHPRLGNTLIHELVMSVQGHTANTVPKAVQKPLEILLKYGVELDAVNVNGDKAHEWADARGLQALGRLLRASRAANEVDTPNGPDKKSGASPA